jgi:hypothetical protein
VRGAKRPINHFSNDRAKEHFELEREIIFKLIGSPNQVEAITANFEKREPKSGMSDRGFLNLRRRTSADYDGRFIRRMGLYGPRRTVWDGGECAQLFPNPSWPERRK